MQWTVMSGFEIKSHMSRIIIT